MNYILLAWVYIDERAYYQIVRATIYMHAADSHPEQDLSSLNLNVL